ncbi:MAG: hypothetical protein NC548_37790 [Lachnospiraceae bacterium]|nr:hypothetical protein [Lachnospiraceae bacterium]MCM1233006.1 hypothetical protein [Ruminococcus flavefaciens]
MDIFEYLEKVDPTPSNPHYPQTVGCVVWHRCEPDETSRVEVIIPNDCFLKPAEALQGHPAIVRFEDNLQSDNGHPHVKYQMVSSAKDLWELLESIIEGECWAPINPATSASDTATDTSKEE